MKHIKWIIVIAVAVLLLVSPCVKAEYVSGKETLRGIEGMAVAVEDLSPNVKELGLTEDILQTDIELKLKLAGIKVLSIEESVKTLRSPYLYLNILTVTHPSGVLFSWNVSLRLRQMVDLRTKKNTYTKAITWKKLRTGYAEKDILKDGLRKITKDMVDEFLNDYLAINPKQVDKPKKK